MLSKVSACSLPRARQEVEAEAQELHEVLHLGEGLARPVLPVHQEDHVKGLLADLYLPSPETVAEGALEAHEVVQFFKGGVGVGLHVLRARPVYVDVGEEEVAEELVLVLRELAQEEGHVQEDAGPRSPSQRPTRATVRWGV